MRKTFLVLFTIIIGLSFTACKKKEVVDLELENFFTELSALYLIENIEKNINEYYLDGKAQKAKSFHNYGESVIDSFDENSFVEEIHNSDGNYEIKIVLRKKFFFDYAGLFVNGIKSGKTIEKNISSMLTPNIQPIFYGFTIYHINNDELLAEAATGKLNFATFYINFEEQNGEQVILDDYKITEISIKTVVNGNFLAIYDNLENEEEFINAFKSVSIK
jgi:hypothetical protein